MKLAYQTKKGDDRFAHHLEMYNVITIMSVKYFSVKWAIRGHGTDIRGTGVLGNGIQESDIRGKVAHSSNVYIVAPGLKSSPVRRYLEI